MITRSPFAGALLVEGIYSLPAAVGSVAFTPAAGAILPVDINRPFRILRCEVDIVATAMQTPTFYVVQIINPTSSLSSTAENAVSEYRPLASMNGFPYRTIVINTRDAPMISPAAANTSLVEVSTSAIVGNNFATGTVMRVRALVQYGKQQNL